MYGFSSELWEGSDEVGDFKKYHRLFHKLCEALLCKYAMLPRPKPDEFTSWTRKPLPDYPFVLLDCLDDGGQPTTSDVVKSKIRADVARKGRAQRAANQVCTIRSSTLAVKLLGMKLILYRRMTFVNLL